MTTLEASYKRCRQLSKTHGATYYAAIFLLPRVKRHHVHALDGFCRHVDDLVEELGAVPVADRERVLTETGDRFFDDLDRGDSEDPVFKAVVHTVIAFDINPDCFRRVLRSKRTDLTVSEYETFDDLLDYTDGSAAAIAEMMLPILEPISGDAITPARDLGIAFQLTAFLRDVDADLDRQRVYLPQEDLRRFGADPWLRRCTPEWQRLMDFEIGRAREYFASGDRGLSMLPPASARSVRATRALYLEVLDRVDAARGDVFLRRPRASVVRRALAVGRGIIDR